MYVRTCAWIRKHLYMYLLYVYAYVYTCRLYIQNWRAHGMHARAWCVNCVFSHVEGDAFDDQNSRRSWDMRKVCVLHEKRRWDRTGLRRKKTDMMGLWKERERVRERERERERGRTWERYLICIYIYISACMYIYVYVCAYVFVWYICNICMYVCIYTDQSNVHMAYRTMQRTWESPKTKYY